MRINFLKRCPLKRIIDRSIALPVICYLLFVVPGLCQTGKTGTVSKMAKHDTINSYTAGQPVKVGTDFRIYGVAQLDSNVSAESAIARFGKLRRTGNFVTWRTLAGYDTMATRAYVRSITPGYYSLQVRESDGTPAVAGVDSIDIDASTMTVTNPSGARALITVREAGTSEKGVVTISAQTFAGNKTFAGTVQTMQGNLTLGIGSSANGSVTFKNLTNSYGTTLFAPNATTNRSITLPDIAGVLATNAVAGGGTGVTDLSNILGTTNQVIVGNGVDRVIGGDVTLSLPQDIATTSDVTFSAGYFRDTVYIGNPNTRTGRIMFYKACGDNTQFDELSVQSTCGANRKYFLPDMPSDGTYFLSLKDYDTIPRALEYSGLAAADSEYFFESPWGTCEVISVRAWRDGGTAAYINIQKDSGGVKSNLLSVNDTVTTTAQNMGNLQNGTLAYQNRLKIFVTSVTGTVTKLFIQILFRRAQL